MQKRHLQSLVSLFVIAGCLLYLGMQWWSGRSGPTLGPKTEISECHFLLKNSYVDAVNGKAMLLAGARSLLAKAKPPEGTDWLTRIEKAPEDQALVDLEALTREVADDPAHNLTREEAVYDVLQGMVASLHDPYTIAMDPATFARFQETLHSQPFGGVGLQLGRQGQQIMVFAVLADTPAAAAGVRVGDLLTSIEEKPVSGLPVEDVEAMLHGEPGSDVFCRFLRGRDAYSRTLKRVLLKSRSVHSRVLQIPDGPRVAWISVSAFQDFTGKEMGEELAAVKKQRPAGIILDLRDNVGGFVEAALEVASYFVPSGQVVVEIRSRDEKEVKTTISETTETLPLLVFVNKRTASSAEILTACLQDHKRGTVVGERTFGKASVQSVYEFANGGGLKYTTARYRSPNGRVLDGSGLQPDLQMEELQLLEYCKSQWTKKK